MKAADWSLAFEKLGGLRILVVGDLMLDRYLWGRVERLSPEAPAPVVDLERVEERPGGAANVAANVASLGAMPYVLGLVGDDDDGQSLKRLIPGRVHAVPSSRRPTTVKTRVMGEGRQLVRIDRENTRPPDERETATLIADFCRLYHEVSPHAVILEDYDKGVFGPELIEAIVEKSTVPVFADPKTRNFHAFAGVTVFKPNVKELGAGVGRKLRRDDTAAIASAASALRQSMPHDYTFVTMSEHGALWMDQTGTATHLPAHVRQITDVSGAGDAVVATLACLVAAGVPMLDAARAANRAGGWVCEKPGVAPIQSQPLLHELLQQSN